MSEPFLLPPRRASASLEEVSVGHLWHALVRRRWLILALTLATILAAAAITWLQPPKYESEATILLSERENVGLGGLLPAGLGEMAGLSKGGGIQTDIALLKSRQVAEAVVDSLRLQVQLLSPARSRAAVLSVLEAPRELGGAEFTLTRLDDGSFAMQQTEGRSVAPVPSRVEIGRPFKLGAATLALHPHLAADAPREITIGFQPFREAVAAIREELKIDAAPGAQILNVAFRSGDPVLAAAVPNVATQSFIDYKTATATVESRNKIRFLQDQLVTYDEQLRAAEADLQNFRERAQIVEPKTQAAEQIRRLAELQSQREALVTEREALRRLLSRIEAEPAAARGQSPYRQLVAFPSFLSNGAVQSALQLINELENKRADLLVRRTEQNIDVQGINSRIQELELQLFQLARDYLDGLDTKLAATVTSLDRFGLQLEQVPSKEVQFARLTRDRELLEGVYTLLQTSLKEEEIRGAEQAPEIRVVDAALVPEAPASPRPLINLLLGAVLGLVLGVGAVLVRETSDTRVRTARDALAAAPGIPVLGVLPRSAAAPAGSYLERLGVPRRNQTSPDGGGIHRLITATAPQSAASEAYRTLRTNLTHTEAGRGVRVLVVTSAAAGDGKTTVAANLAIAMAQQGTRTLLVDGDLRKGMLHELLGVSPRPGLTEVLRGESQLEASIQRLRIGESETPLHFLGAGAFPTNPAELLGSEAMQRVLVTLHDQYQAVVIDTPPVNLVTDAAVLGTMSDRTLLVARAGLTDQASLYEAAARLSQVNNRLGGVILNNAEALRNGEDYYAAVMDASGSA